MVQGLIAHAQMEPTPKVVSYIVPHAGYIYSGPIAAAVYARLAAVRGPSR